MILQLERSYAIVARDTNRAGDLTGFPLYFARFFKWEILVYPGENLVSPRKILVKNTIFPFCKQL